LDVLTIYGSEDGVLNFEKYQEAKENLPEGFKEMIIEGGNHAGFGYYGEQKKDGKSKISKVEQQELTVQEILKMIKLYLLSYI